jgi:hypothetical protein
MKSLLMYLKKWWCRNIVDRCPSEWDEYFDYNPNKEN